MGGVESALLSLDRLCASNSVSLNNINTPLLHQALEAQHTVNAFTKSLEQEQVETAALVETIQAYVRPHLTDLNAAITMERGALQSGGSLTAGMDGYEETTPADPPKKKVTSVIVTQQPISKKLSRPATVGHLVRSQTQRSEFKRTPFMQ